MRASDELLQVLHDGVLGESHAGKCQIGQSLTIEQASRLKIRQGNGCERQPVGLIQKRSQLFPATLIGLDKVMNGHEQNFPVRNVIVRTPENLEIKYELAGAGTRAVAFLVDATLMYLILSLLQGLVIAVVLPFGEKHPIYAGAVMALVSFLFFNGYFVIFEMLWAGQSPGKRTVGIRVVKKGGYALRLIDSLIRNLIRTVDFLPACYGVGLVTLLCTRYSQRLGDLVAGTLVVYENRVRTSSPFTSTSAEGLADESSILPQLQLASVPAEVIETCDEFLRTKSELASAPRQQIASELVYLIEKTSGLTPGSRQSDEAFLNCAVTEFGRTPAARPESQL